MTKSHLVNRLGLAILKLGERFFRTQNVGLAELRGSRLGMLLFLLDSKHRKRSLENLSIVFPEMPTRERTQMVKSMFRHFGLVVADFMRSPIRTDEEIVSKTKIEGEEHLTEALNGSHGVLLVTAHLGNWERMGHWLRHRGIKVSAVARDTNETLLTEKLLEVRNQRGMNVLSRGNAAREIIKLLRANEMIGILPDQNADEAYLPFFGKMAGTVLGPAVLHLRTKAPILPVAHLRTGVGEYRTVFLPMLTAMESETPEELMTRVNGALESLIMLAPEQYLWMHDRYKYARIRGVF